MTKTNQETAPPSGEAFGVRLVSRLSDAGDDLPHHVTERLRTARLQAVERRRQILLQNASIVFVDGRGGTLSASQGGNGPHWWRRLGAIGMLLTLLSGLFIINTVQNELGARELADIDAAILADELPPSAYVDAGFAQFLKIGNAQEP